MIIGFDGSRAFNSIKTGTENYSYQLLKALAKIDHKNQYIVYLRPGLVKDSRWPVNFQFSILNFQFLWTQVGLALQTFRDNLDILFTPAHTLPLIRKKGLKTVMTIHDLGAEYLPKMHDLKQRLYLKGISNFQLNSASKLIAVSNATKDDLIKKVKVNAKKIAVIYEGYDKSLYKPVKNDLLVNRLRQYELVPQSYFLFVGTIQPRKNLERLIIVFSKYLSQTSKNHDSKFIIHNSITKLVIVGSKGWMSDEIYNLPKRLGIEDRVKFLGYVPDKDMKALYSGSIALTYPSLFEGFGLPIIEAQACGCPVITSNISSMPEVAGSGALLVDPYSKDDIVKAMVRIMNYTMPAGRQELRIKIVRAGFENVKRFSWEKCARETIKALEEAVSSETSEKIS